jgi:hypothetical protein
MTGYAKRRRRAFQFMQYFLNKHSIHSYQIKGSNVLLAANEEIQTLKSIRHAQEIRAEIYSHDFKVAGGISGSAHMEETEQSGNSVEVSSRPKVTAVLVNWKRSNNLIKIASVLSTLSYVNDIVIYENNRQHPMTMEPPHLWPNSERLKRMVRLVHEDGAKNLNTESRFRGCGEYAKNDVCKYCYTVICFFCVFRQVAYQYIFPVSYTLMFDQKKFLQKHA